MEPSRASEKAKGQTAGLTGRLRKAASPRPLAALLAAWSGALISKPSGQRRGPTGHRSPECRDPGCRTTGDDASVDLPPDELYAKAAQILEDADLSSDMSFFAACPGRTFRLRPASILELMEAGAPFILAAKTGPGSRQRLAINLELPAGDHRPFDTEAHCRELFENLQGVEGGVP